MATKKSTPITPAAPITEIGIGLDIGTANLRSARAVKQSEGVYEAEIEHVRDCFLPFPQEDEGILVSAGVAYHETSTGDLVVIGDDALRLSAALGLELRRPLAQGFISDKEGMGKDVVKILLSEVLGTPKVANETVAFSIPGIPVGGDETKAAFHTRFFKERISELGFNPIPVNEAMAVGHNVLRSHKVPSADPNDMSNRVYTGLCFSFGAGMINVALLYQGLCSKSFSIAQGGDYIDEAAAKTTGTPVASVTLLKEEGIDLIADRAKNVDRNNVCWITNPQEHHDDTARRQAEHIVMNYKGMLENLRAVMEKFFTDPKNRVDIRETLPAIIAGGTSQARGFRELFNEIVLDGLDIRLNIDKKGAIRAADPLGAVSVGALWFARSRKVGKALSSLPLPRTKHVVVDQGEDGLEEA